MFHQNMPVGRKTLKRNAKKALRTIDICRAAPVIYLGLMSNLYVRLNRTYEGMVL